MGVMTRRAIRVQIQLCGSLLLAFQAGCAAISSTETNSQSVPPVPPQVAQTVSEIQTMTHWETAQPTPGQSGHFQESNTRTWITVATSSVLTDDAVVQEVVARNPSLAQMIAAPGWMAAIHKRFRSKIRLVQE